MSKKGTAGAIPVYSNILFVFRFLPAAGGAAAVIVIIVVPVIGLEREHAAVYLLQFLLLQFFLGLFLLSVFHPASPLCCQAAV